MPLWKLNAHQRQLLASCIEIGAEGAADNHVEVGGDNSQEDLELIARIIEELQESNADETTIQIAPTVSGDWSSPCGDDAGEHEDYSETIGIPSDHTCRPFVLDPDID